MPAARSRSMYEDSARSEPVTSAPSCRQTSARPLMPAPPIAMKWSLRPRMSSAIGRLQYLARGSLRSVGLGKAAGGDAHLAEPVLVGEQLGDRGAQPFRSQVAIEQHDGGAAVGHPAGVRRLVVRRRMGIRN